MGVKVENWESCDSIINKIYIRKGFEKGRTMFYLLYLGQQIHSFLVIFSFKIQVQWEGTSLVFEMAIWTA